MSILFQNRDGETFLEESMRDGLIPSHINDMTELYEYEIENIALGIEWSRQTNKNHKDYFTWLKLHKEMFSDVWRWAGVIRSRELANLDFVMPCNVRPELKKVQEDLICWLKNSTYQEREMVAILHERLLTIHPFSDGNGRWARLLVNMICKREGLEIPSWGATIKDDQERRDQYIASVKKARNKQNYSDLISIIYLR